MPKQWIRMIIFAMCFSVAADDWKAFYRENRKNFNDDKKAAATILDCATYDNADAAKILLRIACRRTAALDQRAQALWVLRQYRSEASKTAIAECFKKISSYDAHTLAFAIELDLVPLRKRLSLMNGNDPQVVAVAIQGLGKTGEHSAHIVDMLCRRMKTMSTCRSVQIAGMEALGGIDSRLSVPILLERLGDELYQSAAGDALTRLTGETYGSDVDAWKAWLDENPEFPPVNTSVKDHLESKKREKNQDNNEKWAEFYGMIVTGKNILFVLDHSDSMSAVRGKITRLERLKEEFKGMSDALPETVSFGLLLFPGNEFFPRAYLGKATGLFKKRINRYLQRIKPDGSTPIEEAMIVAFEKVVARRDVDAMYLISDGSPNKLSAVVRRTIKELNRGHYVKINTLSIGGESTFLKDVAADNQGEYKVINE